MRAYVDRGGTFTDLLHLEPAGLRLEKVPSDQAVVGRQVQGPVVLGTTVTTNALLEGRRARVLLLVTAGFEDLPRLRDMARPALFDPDQGWPAPLAARVAGVVGRLDASGREVVPLEVPALDLADLDAVAIALLHGGAHPAHEVALLSALQARFPGFPCFASHQLSREVGYLARLETVTLHAALTPVLQEALRRDQLPAGSQALRSDGSLVPWEDLVAPDAVLSGPAGGVLAVAALARQLGLAEVVGLDMGGTSTDVCRVVQGALPRRSATVIAGHRIQRVVLDVETIAAGGGSVVSRSGPFLRVGPTSAGADPGPASRGRGGPPTVTDAALLLGLVDPAAYDPPLDPTQVALGASPEAVLAVAREAMAQALRRVATRRGADLARHVLVAFGGAAGQHAAAIAERVGIRAVLIHPAAALFSAWGMAHARREETASLPLTGPLLGGGEALARAWAALEARLPAWGDRARTVSVRYRGTEGILELAACDDLARAFRAEHRRVFGFDRHELGDEALELVSARVRVAGPPPPPLPPLPDPFGVGEAPRPGPLRLRSPTTTVEVPAGWTARFHQGVLQLEAVAPTGSDEDDPAAALTLWSARFLGVAEAGGEALRALARSVSVRERLDFSCGVFDAAGGLVANAPHIPVHLGAMGETVRDLIDQQAELPDGSVWLTNDPMAGGSHLPDLTVITVVIHQGIRFFVASRAHHADVGGSTPGSMPPDSRRLSEEGLVVRRRLLVRDGQRLPWSDLLAASRLPDWLAADLEAQVAAGRVMAEQLRALGPAATLARWMEALAEASAEATRRLLDRLPANAEAEELLDGIPLRLRWARQGDRLVVDLRGTGGPHPGNLNAPRAVVRASLLYALAVLSGAELPLNEGTLRPIVLLLSPGSLLDPPPGAAVAGGNVETSQRLADLFLRAAGDRAASCGTMTNLSLGGDGWQLYETLGGGQGASGRGPGLSGLQCHLTNTRATDPEVLEQRLPVRLWAFRLRPGSGGSGQHRGGDGLEREIELLAPATGALLQAARPGGAPGLAGGGHGAPPIRSLYRGGAWGPWDGSPQRLAPGDRVRLATPGGGGYGPVGSPP